VCEQEVPQAAPTQQATANQQAHDAPPLLFSLSLLTLDVLVLRLITVADEPGEQGTAQSPTTHGTTAQGESREFLCFGHTVLLTV
jgi:hypothetical protein